MILTVLSWFPGVLGLVLRQKLFPLFLKKCGRNVLFGRFVKLEGAGHICLGDNVVINDWAVLEARCRGDSEDLIVVEDNVFIGAGSRIISSGGKVTLKNNANIGSECKIVAECRTIIEENVLLAAFCQIGGGSEKSTPFFEEGETVGRESIFETRVGHGCWLGVRAFIGSGVKIGHGTIVGAHGRVEDDLPINIVAVGHPAKKLYAREAS